jgi:hypothetical protein
MARRQRTLYEFVDPDELAREEVVSETDGPSANARQRRNAGGRVVAGLALLAGLALFVVGVLELRSPLTSVADGDAPSATRTVQRSVLPVSHARRPRSRRAHRRARTERLARSRVRAQRVPRPEHPAPMHRAPVQPVAPRHWSVPRVTPTQTRMAPASRGASEFGFEH